MQDTRVENVILGIRIHRENNNVTITQSHYIDKILRKFNFYDPANVLPPCDPSIKLISNDEKPIAQWEYSRIIRFLMYAMTCTRSDIAFAVGN